MKARVAINGFGRIGRMVLRIAEENGLEGFEIVAINARSDAKTLAHLFTYDSSYGVFRGKVETDEKENIIVNGRKIKVLKENDPENLPWKEMGVDIVIESTGKFTKKEDAQKHINAGAKKVIITAPGKNEDKTIVMGVNENEYDSSTHHIISNASCTTNCIAPVVKVLDSEFGIEKGLMTTIHAYTNDQQILDKTHKDLRRARSAGVSMIPTTTGAAKAVSKVLPDLEGKLNGFAVRVPSPSVSMVDLVCEFSRDVSVEEVNKVLENASKKELNGVLGYSDLPLVSIDYKQTSESSIVDGLSTMVNDGNLVKVVAWYDNEWGYSCRTVDLVSYVAKELLISSKASA
ncbi:type I glyceraldehyde-3-phosphate dehydrogenase [Paraclostridium ghonii]|uniref:Glyceraldehyde-3-phosphate dehydrogenase n=1 Tax=Paraclostridium ghonii TaxID=29358 RepID=A0ABU0MZ21_9FIRM|nr:type I glyceraldehyde-3-phosphate dehydrogenase [Paeniclostridium ghonii]MDQ0556162.1 glyceraldehyde 3-phosphate dehydrogenase [Paeniclostridium ghonii]